MHRGWWGQQGAGAIRGTCILYLGDVLLHPCWQTEHSQVGCALLLPRVVYIIAPAAAVWLGLHSCSILQPFFSTLLPSSPTVPTPSCPVLSPGCRQLGVGHECHVVRHVCARGVLLPHHDHSHHVPHRWGSREWGGGVRWRESATTTLTLLLQAGCQHMQDAQTNWGLVRVVITCHWPLAAAHPAACPCACRPLQPKHSVFCVRIVTQFPLCIACPHASPCMPHHPTWHVVVANRVLAVYVIMRVLYARAGLLPRPAPPAKRYLSSGGGPLASPPAAGNRGVSELELADLEWGDDGWGEADQEAMGLLAGEAPTHRKAAAAAHRAHH